MCISETLQLVWVFLMVAKCPRKHCTYHHVAYPLGPNSNIRNVSPLWFQRVQRRLLCHYRATIYHIYTWSMVCIPYTMPCKGARSGTIASRNRHPKRSFRVGGSLGSDKMLHHIRRCLVSEPLESENVFYSKLRWIWGTSQIPIPLDFSSFPGW